MLNTERDILFLDGECGLCHGLAFFMDDRLAIGDDISYRPIQSEEVQDIISSFPAKQKRADTVYLIRRNSIYIRSSAAIRCLLYLKWYWKLWFPILWIIPLPIRDTIYRIIAMNRHRIFKRPDLCSFRIDQD